MDSIKDLRSAIEADQKRKDAFNRIENLLDSGSFIESMGFSYDSGVITGSGRVDNRAVYVYSQYNTVNLNQAKKLETIYTSAITMGAPIIALLDSKGMELDNGIETLESYGMIYKIMSDASGVIPQINIVVGECMGTASVICGLGDFVIAKSDSKIFMRSPNSFVEKNSFKDTELFSGSYHYNHTGTVDLLCESLEDCINKAKELLSFIPTNNLEDAPVLSGASEITQTNIDTNNLDIHKVIDSVIDSNEFLEIKGGFSKDIVIGFGRFDGLVSGIIANNGPLTSSAIKKATKLISFCDAFNIPIVTFTNVATYGDSFCDENNIIADSAGLIYAFTNATVAKINIILNIACGSPYLVMNSKNTGADLVYAWESSDLSLFEPHAAEKVIGDSKNLLSKAALSGYIDDIIEPKDTRGRIINALESLYTKRIFKHPKKHGSIVF